jgi:hypothetical protein
MYQLGVTNQLIARALFSHFLAASFSPRAKRRSPQSQFVCDPPAPAPAARVARTGANSTKLDATYIVLGTCVHT